jgi:hypothetical protein
MKRRLRVNWVFRDGSRWIRGHDIVETDDPEFDDSDAEDLMSKIMHPCKKEDKERMPNFSKNICADSPQTWKVLSIKRARLLTTRTGSFKDELR